MTGVRIGVSVDEEEVQAVFARFAALDGDQTSLMRKLGAAFRQTVDERFEMERGPGGLPWTKSQRAEEQGGQTLTDTGRLRQSITYVAGPRGVEIGTNVLYAAIHQFGGEIRQPAYARSVAFRGGRFARTTGSRPPKRVERRQVAYGERILRMPARPFLGIDRADLAEMEAIIADHLNGLRRSDDT